MFEINQSAWSTEGVTGRPDYIEKPHLRKTKAQNKLLSDEVETIKQAKDEIQKSNENLTKEIQNVQNEKENMKIKTENLSKEIQQIKKHTHQKKTTKH